jgi:O-antigen/teichoic acid export membrane protein
MKGKSSWSLWNTGAALGLNLALNFILIPALGILGAAISLAASRVVANLLPLAQLNSLARLNPFGEIWLRAALTSAVTFGVVALALKFVFGSSLLTAIAAGVVASAIYVPLLLRSGSTVGLEPGLFVPKRSAV